MMHGTFVVNAMLAATMTVSGTASVNNNGIDHSHCTCGGCAGWHIYIPSRLNECDFVIKEQPSITIRPTPIFEKPKSERWPQSMFVLRRSGFHRPGRTLRHRGGFRNFHK